MFRCSSVIRSRVVDELKVFQYCIVHNFLLEDKNNRAVINWYWERTALTLMLVSLSTTSMAPDSKVLLLMITRK